MTPETLGRYEITGELGKGAMGVVYLAQDPIIKRQLAIKTFRMAYSAKEKEIQQFRERFLREAQAIGQLSHPNIVTVHDVGQEEDEYFIAMEYVKGVNLKQRMQRAEGPLPVEFVVDIAAQIAEGLAVAHEKGIVHRDVKPANIILAATSRGRVQVKITDFGIARIDSSKLTVAGQLLGTPNYMAPEQIQGKAVDARTDIFSLGVLLYEMLTRKKPFAGENLTQVSHRIVYDEYTPPEEFVDGLPPELDQVLHRALEKEPDDRYQEAAEMARDLRAILEPEPLTGEVPVVPSGDVGESPVAAASPPPAADSPTPTADSPPSPADSSPVPVEPVAEAAKTADSAVAPSVSPSPPAARLDAESSPKPSSAPRPAAPAPVRPPPPPPSASPPAAAPVSAPSTQVKAQSKRRSGVLHRAASSAPARRWGVALAALVVVTLGATMILTRVLGGSERPPPPPPTPGLAEREIELIRNVHELRQRGTPPEHTLQRLRRYMASLPVSVDLTRLYAEVAEEADGEHSVADDYIQERMAAVDVLVSIKQYEEAYDLLERVLLADSDHEEATAKAEDIERFLNRQRRARIQSARQKRPPPTQHTTTPPPPRVAPPPPAEPVPVTIRFRTHVAEGQVRAYADGQILFQEDFEFDPRKMFKRRFLRSAQGYDRARMLNPGTVELRVEADVEVKDGRKTLRSETLSGNILPNVARTLTVTVGEDLTLDVRFE